VSRKGANTFHAKAQRKGKEDGRLDYSFSLRVSFVVPTSPELQPCEERRGAGTLRKHERKTIVQTAIFLAFPLRLGVKQKSPAGAELSL
jgi:hypothetical protein